MDEENCCTICWEELDFSKTYPAVLNCKCSMIYHLACIREWLDAKGTCPLCRKYVYILDIENEAYLVSDTENDVENQINNISRGNMLYYYINNIESNNDIVISEQSNNNNVENENVENQENENDTRLKKIKKYCCNINVLIGSILSTVGLLVIVSAYYSLNES